MIAECPLSMECRLITVHEMPSNNLVVGEIVGAYTKEHCLSDGKLDFKKVDPIILTMRDNTYWGLGQNVGKAWSEGKRLKAAAPAGYGQLRPACTALLPVPPAIHRHCQNGGHQQSKKD